jgi:hypothetical protein
MAAPSGMNRALSCKIASSSPSNLNSTAARDFFYDPTGATTPYTNATASLNGGTPNILAGDGDHAATDGPAGYQQAHLQRRVERRWHGPQLRMANTPGSIGTIANPITDPFAAGVIQTTTANQLIFENKFYDPYFRAYDQAYPDLWRFNSTHYSQPKVLRTIEDILGTEHLNLNTFYARPMANVFNTESSGKWTFTAVASTLLKLTTLGLDPTKTVFAKGPNLKPTHDAQYWAEKTRGFDFSLEDRVPADLYNKILWEGLKGSPAPVAKTRFPKVDADEKGKDKEADKDGK